MIHLTFDLECITPVVGGGVESREPDEIEALRIPGIRGHVRHWWRALHGGLYPAGDLKKREQGIWGGVEGKDGKDGKDDKPRRSGVTVQARVTFPGRVVPAGRHKSRPGLGYASVPEWVGGKGMGYALFPLQREREELDHATGGSVPTRSIRHDLRFTLLVTLGVPSENGDPCGWVDDVLRTFWAWIHLGGIGARTTRGFGALALLKSPEMAFYACEKTKVLGERGDNDLQSCLDKWKRRFVVPSSLNIDDHLREILKEAATVFPFGSSPYPHLGHVRIVRSGKKVVSAKTAHSDGLDGLFLFRQGSGVGRRAKRGRASGTSVWPEADSLRQRAAIPTEEPAEMAAPRARFGMPLNIRFKDAKDEKANAAIVPLSSSKGGASSDRWTSPLRIRPVKCTDGYITLLIYMNQALPSSEDRTNQGSGGYPNAGGGDDDYVTAKFDSKDVENVNLPASWHPTSSPLGSYLARAKGDAVHAFLLWMEERRSYQRIL